MLLHVPQYGVLAKDHRTSVRRVFPGEDLEQRGFTAAVDSHQPHTFPLLHFKGDILEDHFLAKTLLDIVYR